MTFRAPSPLVWFAVGGGATAWAVQFVAGLAFGFAECNEPGRRIAVHAWQAAVAGAAVVVALASIAAALWLFWHTYRVGDVFGEERRGDGSPPPIGRIHFLALVGLTVNVLALTIIVLDGIGAPLLPLCQQS